MENRTKQIEEKYEVTVSSNYDESGLKLLSPTSPTNIEDKKYVNNIFNKEKKSFSFY